MSEATATPTTRPLDTSARWFVKCPDCLAVGAVPGPNAHYFNNYEIRCSDCGTRLVVMGRVQGVTLMHGTRVPCDLRCTGAVGPHCNCQCGGKNHGLGLSCEIPHCAGEVPRVKLPKAGDVERGKAFRATVKRLTDALCDHPTRLKKRAGAWLTPEEFTEYLGTHYDLLALRKIENMTSHAGREKALGKRFPGALSAGSGLA